jgi:hypothetical protein
MENATRGERLSQLISPPALAGAGNPAGREVAEAAPSAGTHPFVLTRWSPISSEARLPNVIVSCA